MADIEVRAGDVVALVGPNGARRRYMCSTLATGDSHPLYELSDHVEDSPFYDQMLNDRTVLVLRWVDGPVIVSSHTPPEIAPDGAYAAGGLVASVQVHTARWDWQPRDVVSLEAFGETVEDLSPMSARALARRLVEAAAEAERIAATMDGA